jgi:hypothetical protein
MSNPGLSKFIKSPLTNIIEKKNPSQNESNCHPMILFLFLSKINQIGFSGKKISSIYGTKVQKSRTLDAFFRLCYYFDK